eukprot:gb/GECH01000483.1/.p1 GENE.gb/GECH01000483.1/~~gb/GECH01000483.1/.p1  ORF type:complete len:315 (+),score=36.69 gb/GECH01000483.1/:1-945(+)
MSTDLQDVKHSNTNTMSTYDVNESNEIMNGLDEFQGKLTDYIKRATHVSQLDFQYALDQMLKLWIRPHSVFKNSRNRHLIRGKWARDDPGFVVLQIAFLFLAAVAHAFLLFPEHNPTSSPSRWTLPGALTILIIKLCGIYIILAYFLTSIATASLTWWIANWYLCNHTHQPNSSSIIHKMEISESQPLSSSPSSLSSTYHHVEWLYAFDVHSNAYFPLSVILHFIHLILYPLISVTFHSSWFIVQCFSSFLSISIFLCSAIYYLYITFLGFRELPFLRRPEFFMFPIFFLIPCAILTVLMGVNPTMIIVSALFG